jgi:quercetin dioxygenase-like cupin family protein
MEKLSLDALARELMKSATAAPAGRASRTVYGGHEHVLRQTLTVLTAGASMSEHENPGEATVVGCGWWLTPWSGKGATVIC